VSNQARRRRPLGDYVSRDDSVQLSHETRGWLGRIERARSDDDVSLGAFAELMFEFHDHALALPKAERQQAGIIPVEQDLCNILGEAVRLRGLGWI
jgi:hypothetical protein